MTMKRFWFKGTATLRGVQFLIEASSEKNAVNRAHNGEWDEYDISGADTSDWKINPNTCEADE